MPTNKRIHKRIEGHICNEILFSYEQGENYVIYRKMDETRNHQKKISLVLSYEYSVSFICVYVFVCVYIYIHINIHTCP